MPNLDDDEFIGDADPLIRAMRQAKTEYAETRQKYHYLAELSQSPIAAEAYARNRESFTHQARAASANIRSAMQIFSRTCERTRDLERQLVNLKLQVAESRRTEQANHQRIVNMHIQHWRLTGAICDDYRVPPLPEVEMDGSNL